ncbi:MAG: hypothetical protein KKA73_22040 [Chloroflexi bacterium]|nr:hypothetical protein [Chloroflexota bacterium]MBU1750374.1 hypothetical protein [Chloroflexota bacterium]
MVKTSQWLKLSHRSTLSDEQDDYKEYHTLTDIITGESVVQFNTLGSDVLCGHNVGGSRSVYIRGQRVSVYPDQYNAAIYFFPSVDEQVKAVQIGSLDFTGSRVPGWDTPLSLLRPKCWRIRGADDHQMAVMARYEFPRRLHIESVSGDPVCHTDVNRLPFFFGNIHYDQSIACTDIEDLLYLAALACGISCRVFL